MSNHQPRVEARRRFQDHGLCSQARGRWGARLRETRRQLLRTLSRELTGPQPLPDSSGMDRESEEG